MKTYYLTTPIYYVNARPHLGHTYTTIIADAVVRFQRMVGRDVALVTGTDEHGKKIERSAEAAGMDPQKFTDGVSAEFRSLWDRLGLGYTHFVRTSSPQHRKAVLKIFEAVEKAGYIYKGSYRGRYCVSDEAFITDTAEEEVDCPLCGRPTELVEEENYFFKLSAFQEPLLELYKKDLEFVRPQTRRNEVVRFVEEGLKDLSISRKNLKWGIPFPLETDQVFYVWFDALTSYLSGVGYGKGPEEEKFFRKCWPADVHLVGKEILRFHAVYWPAFLMAAGLPLPKKIYAHGWLLFEQDKMSKSKGNVVRAEPLAEAVGIDGLRYYLMRDIVFGQDSSFSYDGLVQRFNSDLANDLGNLASRTMNMIGRYFEGVVPEPDKESEGRQEKHIRELAAKTLADYQKRFENFEFSRALEALWQFIGRINKYLVETQPWVLAGKPDEASRAKLSTVLYTSAEAVRLSAVLLYPVIPRSAQKLWAQLGFTGVLENQRFKDLAWGGLPAGQKTGAAQAIFPRLDKKETVQKITAANAAEEKPKNGNEKGKGKKMSSEVFGEETGIISIDDFAKVDLRVGEIKTAERIEGATKLLKLTVDIGSEVRQVLAGIAEYYEPQSLVGRKVVVVANLKPRKMRGHESQGMVVAASLGEEGKPVLVTFAEEVPNGARLR